MQTRDRHHFKLQSLQFLISSKANDAANRADNTIAIVVAAAAVGLVVELIIMVKSELLMYRPTDNANDVSSPLEIDIIIIVMRQLTVI